MSEKEKELMKRYIYEVTRRVARDQREEISMELSELISDMYEDENATMESILTELGDPADFAKKYRDDSNYVISPEYYENYTWVLKIVLGCVLLGTVVSMLVGIVAGDIIRIDTAIESVMDIPVSLIFAFGMVTLIFACLERQKINVQVKQGMVAVGIESEGWNVGLLEPVPDKKALISRGETTVAIAFLGIFGALLMFAPELLGAYVFEDGRLLCTIPIFNLEQWSVIFPIVIIAFLAGFFDEIIRLISGTYNIVVMVSNIIAGSVQVVLAAIALKVLPIWNPNFVDEISRQFNINISSKNDILYYWNSEPFSNILLAIICMVIVLEITTTIYKTLRFGVKG